MKYFFLDVVDAGIPANSIWPFLIVLALTVLVEAGSMVFMKYNHFKKTLLDSFVVNLASLAVGFGISYVFPDWFNFRHIENFLLLMLITIAVELGILYLLNKKLNFKFTAIVCTVMNIVSYILFYIFIVKMELLN